MRNARQCDGGLPPPENDPECSRRSLPTSNDVSGRSERQQQTGKRVLRRGERAFLVDAPAVVVPDSYFRSGACGHSAGHGARHLCISVSWERENNVLRQQALEITKGLRNDAERILAVNSWGYHNKGFAKNNSSFLLPQLGPTPLQVVEGGGNCSDKSRLVAAMLNELGIRAGLVMLFPCADCTPIHTVVEAVYEYGRMVVDPVWNIYYPDGDHKFLGVAELAATDRSRQHLFQLQQQESAANTDTIEKIKLMPEAQATFDFAKSINWDRNWATRTASALLQVAGIAPEKIMRPRLAEDPKLTISVVLLIGGIGCILAIFCAMCCRRTRRVLLH